VRAKDWKRLRSRHQVLDYGFVLLHALLAIRLGLACLRPAAARGS